MRLLNLAIANQITTASTAEGPFRRARHGWSIAVVGALAAVVLSFTAVASAGPLSGMLERAVGHRVIKSVGERFGPAGTEPVALPTGKGFYECRHLFPQSDALEVAKVDAHWRPTALCSNHFAVLYSGLSKTPLLVVERLNHQQLAEALDKKRTEEFFADPRLPRGSRAELEDYRGSGLDRGHLAAAGNQPDQESMAQSFALSNMVPQDPFNNRKVWSKVESDVRKFVRRASGNVFVFSGPLFRGQQRTIGLGRVWVPSHLFKMVYDESSGRSWAYIVTNTSEARVEPPVDYAEFVRQTGWALLSSRESATATR